MVKINSLFEQALRSIMLYLLCAACFLLQYILSTGVDLTGLQACDSVIEGERGYKSFFVFLLFLEFKGEFRRIFLYTILSWYDKFIDFFKNHLYGTVLFFKDDFFWHLNGVTKHTRWGYSRGACNPVRVIN